MKQTATIGMATTAMAHKKSASSSSSPQHCAQNTHTKTFALSLFLSLTRPLAHILKSIDIWVRTSILSPARPWTHHFATCRNMEKGAESVNRRGLGLNRRGAWYGQHVTWILGTWGFFLCLTVVWGFQGRHKENVWVLFFGWMNKEDFFYYCYFSQKGLNVWA